MSGLINRLDILEPEWLERMQKLQKKFHNNPEYDENGSLSIRMKSAKRFFALCDYKLHHDIKSFRKNLRDSSALVKSLYDRYNQGESIDESFVTMNSYDHILDALAAGDFSLAKDFAQVIGGREAIEKENDHPFDFAFGYALKSLLLNHQTDLEYWLPIANSEVKRPDVKYFQAYVDSLYALKNKDIEAFNNAMTQLLQDHRKMCQARGLLENTVDEALCFWGLGLVNLARHRGLEVTVDDEYLSSELII